MYDLIISSKLKTAKQFKHWITHDVLPSIRKHGIYAIDEVLNDPDMLIAALTELKAERQKTKQLTETVAIQNQQLLEMKPKANYCDIVLNCKDVVSISVIAKDYGKSAKWLNEKLHELKIQYKQGDTWLLYWNYAENGYTSTRTYVCEDSYGGKHSVVHTYWTQKGRLFLYEMLKTKANIIPMIERNK